MKKTINHQRPERGQSMVEFALVITILMILLAGVIDMGRAFFTYMAMRDAAQEGAAYGSLNPTSIGGIQDRVWDNLDQVVPNLMMVNPDRQSITFGSASAMDMGPSAWATRSRSMFFMMQFPLAMPFLGWILNSQTLPIHATINDSILRPTCGEH